MGIFLSVVFCYSKWLYIIENYMAWKINLTSTSNFYFMLANEKLLLWKLCRGLIVAVCVVSQNRSSVVTVYCSGFNLVFGVLFEVMD